MSTNRTVLVLNCGSSSLKYRCRGTGFGPTGGRRHRRAHRGGPGGRPRGGLAGSLRRALRRGVRPRTSWASSRSGTGWSTADPTCTGPRVVDDDLIATLETLSPLAPLHNPPALLGIEVARARPAEPSPRRGVRHRVLSRSAACRRDLRHRPRRGRAVAHPPVRLSRHIASVRQRAGRRVPGTAAGVVESDRASPRKRRLGVGDRGRPPAGHVDGPDAAWRGW